MKPSSAMQDVYFSPDYPSPYTPQGRSTSLEHQYGAFVHTDGHSLGHPDAPDMYQDEVGDHIISLARTSEDRAMNIISSERDLLRAYRAEANHFSQAPVLPTAKLPDEVQDCFHGLRVALLHDSRDLEAAARSHLRRSGSLPPAVDIFTTLPGEAGRIQDNIRHTLREVREACREILVPEGVDFPAGYPGNMGSRGVKYMGRKLEGRRSRMED